MSDSSYICVLMPGIGVPLLPKINNSLPVVLLFLLRYVAGLPTLHFDGKLYCMWADSKRSRRVSSVELRAAFESFHDRVAEESP